MLGAGNLCTQKEAVGAMAPTTVSELLKHISVHA